MSYINDSKPTSSSPTNDTKPSTTYSDGFGYLEKQDGFYLLLENGGKIILDQSWNVKSLINYTNDTK